MIKIIKIAGFAIFCSAIVVFSVFICSAQANRANNTEDRLISVKTELLKDGMVYTEELYEVVE